MIQKIIDEMKNAVGQVICNDINQMGTGFFISDEGHFITNNHVIHRMHIDANTGAIRIDYSTQIVVKIDGNMYNATLLMDQTADRPVVYDYAILKVEFKPTTYFEIANIVDIMQGEEVIALGYPLDFNELVVTTGVLSAIISRPSHINSLHRIKTFLIDVLITYGNSGGPLIRASDGKVIGINTMPYEIRDKLKDRLIRYTTHPELKQFINPPQRDTINFVLKYLNLGFNYAISIEYAIDDPVLRSDEGGG